jgi:hypothetical protein
MEKDGTHMSRIDLPPTGPHLIADKVVVTTRNSAGTLTDQPCWLVVYC